MLNQEIIDSYNLKKTLYAPDWDDRGYEYVLPLGISVYGFFMLNNTKHDMDSLEGLDGYIYINTKQELEKYINFKSIEETFDYIKSKNSNFPIKKYMEEYI